MRFGLSDLLGNVGVVILIIAYLLLQLNRLSSNGLIYSLLNMFGSVLITLSLLSRFNLSAFLIEIFWILISFIGVFRYLRIKTLRS